MKRKNIIAFGALLFSAFTLASCTINTPSDIVVGSETGGSPIDKIPDHVHTFVDVETVEATCTAEGYTKQKCSSCDETKTTNVTNKKAHTKGEMVIENYVAPTCTEAGKRDKVYYCTVCNFEMGRIEEEIPALGHDLSDDPSYLAPTCTTDGYTSGVACKRSGCTYHATTGTIPALGHDYTYEIDNDLNVVTKTITSSGDKQIMAECRNCHSKSVGGVVLNPTNEYELVQLMSNPQYSSIESTHKTGYAKMWEQFYDDCYAVLSSTTDYSTTTVSSFKYSDYGMTVDEAGAVAFEFIYANPQFYFLDTSITFGMYTLNLQMDKSCKTSSYRKTIEKSLVQFNARFYEGITASMTDYQKAKYIHDFIANEIDYAYKSPGVPEDAFYAHSIIAAVDGVAATNGVCECYSKTYLYLSHLVGLESIMVVGASGKTMSTLGGHAWNYTKIEGNWYGIDVTWDDNDTYPYEFFLCSKSTLFNGTSHFSNTMHVPGQSNPAYVYNESTDTLEKKMFQVVLPTLSDTAYSAA